MARGRIFSDPQKRANMLKLRIRGYSYVRLARKYNVDHTTIIYHCKEAGIALPVKIKNEMYNFIKMGVLPNDISFKLGIRKEVIDFYIATYGQFGNKVFSRRVIRNKRSSFKYPKPIKFTKSKIRIRPIWWKIAKKVQPIILKLPQYVSMREEIAEAPSQLPLTKTDERGVEWMEDGKGGWICLGMPKEAEKANQERKRLKGLELKRLQMLTY